MGSSSSSYVAQDTLLAVCSKAGLDEAKILSCDVRTPNDFREIFSLATDDIMIFSDAGPGVTSEAALRVEREMSAAGIAKHAGKDVDDALDATCVGVDLVNGVE